MQLLTRKIRQQLPPLHATDGIKDPLVVCCLLPGSIACAFYAIEYDGRDTLLVLSVTDDLNLKYFSLSGFKRICREVNEEPRRDRGFTPQPLSRVLNYYHSSL